jgi:hypothetical protein
MVGRKTPHHNKRKYFASLLLIILIVPFADLLAVESKSNDFTKTFINIREFGAKGDGNTLCTKIIQKAIDQCSKNGGGTVYFPPGTYLTGTLHLKSNLTLYLEAGATLLASGNIEDYELIEKENAILSQYYFLYAEDVENITIQGGGLIDGQGQAFWTDKRQRPHHPRLVAKEKRPRALSFFLKCRDICIKDISIKNSPFFTIWLLGCDDAQITGITIKNPRYGPNTDGLDIDCCKNVHISNCNIDAGDDCIALKSDKARLGYKKACENITVTNCTLSADTCGARIGYEGDAPIRNCLFSNLAIYDCRVGIDFLSIKYKSRFTIAEEGAEIENIAISNIIMDNVDRPFHLWLGKQQEGELKGRLENISISNIIARAKNACFIGGTAEKSVKSVTLDNIKLTMYGDMQPGPGDPESSDVWGKDKTPWAIYCHHAEAIKLNNIQIDWAAATSGWLGAVKFNDVNDIEISGLKARQYDPNTPTICLSDVKGAYIYNCNASAGTGTFLALEGEKAEDIVLGINNLNQAKKKVEFLAGARKQALSQLANN